MSERAAIRPAAWYALALVAATQMISLLDRNILAILAPSIKADLKIGDAEMGLLYGTVFALFYALFSLPLGRLSDGWIRTRLLAITIFFWSLATGLAAFASGFKLLSEQHVELRHDFCIERYLNDEKTTPTEQLKTELLIPIA